MSYYSTIIGRIEYDDEETAQSVYSSFARTVDIQLNGTVIQFDGHYRNIGRRLESELLEDAVSYDLVETTTDGVFKGYVYYDGLHEDYELEEWGEEHVSQPPQKEEFDDESVWWDNYVDWQSKVEVEFAQTH